jgi:hypothetical protein
VAWLLVADFTRRVEGISTTAALVSAYFHLSSTAVAQGDTVERGRSLER